MKGRTKCLIPWNLRVYYLSCFYLEFITPMLLACFKSLENLIKSGYELCVGIGVNYIVYGYLVYYPKPLRSEMT